MLADRFGYTFTFLVTASIQGTATLLQAHRLTPTPTPTPAPYPLPLTPNPNPEPEPNPNPNPYPDSNLLQATLMLVVPRLEQPASSATSAALAAVVVAEAEPDGPVTVAGSVQ